MRTSVKPGFLATLAIFILCTSPLTAQEQNYVHAPSPLPGVEPAMHTPEYWIALQDDADDVIMTPAEIEAFNRQVRTKKVAPRDYYGKPDPLFGSLTSLTNMGLFINPILPLDQPSTLPGDSLRAWLGFNIDMLYKPFNLWGSEEYYDGRNVRYDKKNAGRSRGGDECRQRA